MPNYTMKALNSRNGLAIGGVGGVGGQDQVISTRTLKRTITFDNCLDANGQPLKQGDTIDLFDLPAGLVIAGGAVRTTTVATAATTIDLGDQADGDRWIAAANAHTLGVTKFQAAAVPFMAVAATKTLRLLLKTGTGAGGVFVVSIDFRDMEPEAPLGSFGV